MTSLHAVLDLFGRDPILGYSLLAAVFLGVIALGSGWARRDWVPLLQAPGAQQVVIAVCAAVVLAFFADLAAASAQPWLLAGLARLPLFVLALAYGPSAGLLGGGLFMAVRSLSAPVGWLELVLVLELALVGWLAVWPSPRLSRWAGPLNALLASSLAWATAGVVLAQGGAGAVSLLALRSQGFSLAVLVGTAMMLFALSPRLYRRLFPESALKPAIERRLYSYTQALLHDSRPQGAGPHSSGYAPSPGRTPAARPAADRVAELSDTGAAR